MAEFMDTLEGNAAVKQSGVSMNTLTALLDDAILALYGYHRWPFLKEVNKVLTWTADAVTKSFEGIARITTLRIPDSSTQLRPLTLKDDTGFDEYKYNNYGITKTNVWRDAGLDSGRLTLELFAVPAGAAALQADVYLMPTSGDINDLPAHFRRLVRQMILSEVPGSGVSLANVDFAVREAITREEDMLGDIDYVGPDDFIQATMREVNNPT